jgi:hypothetical protein
MAPTEANCGSYRGEQKIRVPSSSSSVVLFSVSLQLRPRFALFAGTLCSFIILRPGRAECSRRFH